MHYDDYEGILKGMREYLKEAGPYQYIEQTQFEKSAMLELEDVTRRFLRRLEQEQKRNAKSAAADSLKIKKWVLKDQTPINMGGQNKVNIDPSVQFEKNVKDQVIAASGFPIDKAGDHLERVAGVAQRAADKAESKAPKINAEWHRQNVDRLRKEASAPANIKLEGEGAEYQRYLAIGALKKAEADMKAHQVGLDATLAAKIAANDKNHQEIMAEVDAANSRVAEEKATQALEGKIK